MRMILESYDGYEILVAKWRFEGSSQVISFYHDGLGMPIDDIEVVMPKGSWVFEGTL